MAQDDRAALPIEPGEALGGARPMDHRRAKRGMTARNAHIPYSERERRMGHPDTKALRRIDACEVTAVTSSTSSYRDHMTVAGRDAAAASSPRANRSEESAMQVTIGTFNLNNLFSRFDFSADVSTAAASDVKVEERTAFSFDDPSGFKLRTYQGRLVRGKPEKERKLIAARIKRMDLDVLAVQEVEDIDTLHQFVREDLAGLYRHVVLIEGTTRA